MGDGRGPAPERAQLDALLRWREENARQERGASSPLGSPRHHGVARGHRRCARGLDRSGGARYTRTSYRPGPRASGECGRRIAGAGASQRSARRFDACQAVARRAAERPTRRGTSRGDGTADAAGTAAFTASVAGGEGSRPDVRRCRQRTQGVTWNRRRSRPATRLDLAHNSGGRRLDGATARGTSRQAFHAGGPPSPTALAAGDREDDGRLDGRSRHEVGKWAVERRPRQ